MDSSLNIIDVTRVTPSIPDSPLTLPLTFFDLLWLRFHAVERVIFYRLTNATRPLFDSVIVPNLKTSLSSTLSHYLPLAGNLVWNSIDPKPSIVYSPNDAVSFTVAESNSDFSRLTGNKPFPSSTELHPLVPELPGTDETASVVSFQITFFHHQGFSIGVKAHHAVLDGKTTTTFLKCWAHICKQELEQTTNPTLPQDLIPSYDRTVIKPPTTNHDADVLKGWNFLAKKLAGDNEPENPNSLKLLMLRKIDADVFRYTLELTRENIQRLRERLQRKSFAKEIRLSTFVITYSFAITCLIRARGGDPKRPVAYGFAVDCRRILDPPIPSSYFGNCVIAVFGNQLTAETFMGAEGFLAAARLVSDSVEELDESMVWKMPGSLPWGAQILTVAGSTRFGVYGLDFGWGTPEKVVVVSIDQGEAISMAESRDGNGGVEIGFSLKKHEIDLLIDLLHEGLKY